MSLITKETVEKIATLAHLELTETEKETFTAQMSAIVTYIDKLNELDTKDIPPMSHSTLSGDTTYAQRDDQPVASLGQKLALANAPDPGDNHFRIPKVIG